MTTALPHPLSTRSRPSGPPAASVRPVSSGVGRDGSPAAERVSDDLRRGRGDHLSQRRAIAGLDLLATLALGVVGAYQFGLIRRVPEPSLPGLGGDAVDASGEAYAMLRTPDSTLGMASAAVTLVLAGMGDRDRAHDTPLVPLALAGKAVLDAAGGLYLFAEQVTKHKKVCSWCTVAALAQVATVPLALPEARTAWRRLRSR